MFAQFEKNFLSTELILKNNFPQICSFHGSFLLLVVWCWASTAGTSPVCCLGWGQCTRCCAGHCCELTVEPAATAAMEDFSEVFSAESTRNNWNFSLKGMVSYTACCQEGPFTHFSTEDSPWPCKEATLSEQISDFLEPGIYCCSVNGSVRHYSFLRCTPDSVSPILPWHADNLWDKTLDSSVEESVKTELCGWVTVRKYQFSLVPSSRALLHAKLRIS